MVNRDSALAVVLAVFCIGAAGVSATTMRSTLSQEPDDVVDIDFSKLPIGEDQGATAKDALEGEGSQQAAAAKENSEGSSDQKPNSGGQDDQQSQSSSSAREGQEGNAGSSDRSGQSGQSSQSSGQSGQSAQEGGQSGTSDNSGTQKGGQPGLIDRLLNLLPLLVLLVVLVLAYRYRHHLLALGLALASVFGSRETGSAATGPQWPSETPANEVHRAWLSMVDETGIDEPSRRTPAECAAAAIEAGLDPAAVRTLTETFEEVRYGGKPVTDERRERARRELDRLGGGGTA